jgi:RNA polymerase sigma-70 factor (ECF subfamily)
MTGHGDPSPAANRSAETGVDAVLAARMADRDPAALREVIAAYGAGLHRIAYRMTGDAHEAEDIVQETMLRLWDHAPRLAARHPADTAAAAGLRLPGWLKRVATNLAIDRLRLARRVSGDEIPEHADDAPLADALIEAGQRIDTARALVAALPERQRAAIVLTYYEELPNVEAAAVMDMNIKAFESLLLRARAGLRSAFASGMQGDAA